MKTQATAKPKRLPKWSIEFESGRPAPMLPILSYHGLPAATAAEAEAEFHRIHAPTRYKVVSVTRTR